MIEATGITKRFKRVLAVDDVSFTVEQGDSLALWGSNGAGKTTLIRCLLGVFPSTAGRVKIHGVDVRRRGKHARSLVGYVPQELAFHDDARLGASILFFARLRWVDSAAAIASLDKVGLAGHERKRVRDLSGGMKQRLALAIAMIADPPIVVLDEPTSNLDSSGRGEVVETLHRLHGMGKTLVFASHRPDEVVSLAGRVLVMEKGRIVRDTTPTDLWPHNAPVQTMRLHLSNATDQEAASVLREAGLAVHINAHGLCVAVERHRKAEPVAALSRASIDVRDFDMLEDVPTVESTIEARAEPADRNGKKVPI
ncbi:MAG: ABC transporter ATP-binding protein [Phycisphaerales bacterium]